MAGVVVKTPSGYEELSAKAPGIVELVPDPYVALHPDDAAEIGAAEGDTVQIDLNGRTLELPVTLGPTLPRRVAGLPRGLPGLDLAEIPDWALRGVKR